MRILPVVAVSMLVSACAGPLTMQERFYEVAHHNEDSGEVWPLLKREADIRLFVEGATEADLRQLSELSAQISEATGLAVERVSHEGHANVRIHFVDDAEWAAYQRREPYPGACAGDFYYEGTGDPVIHIRIPAALRGTARKRCVAQEYAHSTGLGFDTDGLVDTVFAGGTGTDHLTDVDMVLLRVLYDSRLRNGMSWAEAAPLVEQILAEMEAAGQL